MPEEAVFWGGGGETANRRREVMFQKLVTEREIQGPDGISLAGQGGA